MFDNLNLRNRIFLGSSIPIAVSVLVSGLVFLKAKQADDQVKLIDRHDIVGLQRDVEIGTLRMERSTFEYVNEKNELFVEEYIAGKKDFQQAIKGLQALITDPQQKADVAQLSDIGKKVDTLSTGIIGLVKAGKIAEANKALQAEKLENIDKVIQDVTDDFEKRDTAILQENKKIVDDSLNFLVELVVIGALGSALLSIGLNYLISGGISKTVSDTVNRLVGFLSEISATVEEQERTISNQASSVNETSTTIDELGAASLQSAEQAEASALGASQVLELSENGTQAVEETIDGILKVKDNVRAIAEQIMRLSEQTGQISGISDLVADVANQTNMLALNAAVEAARAGEQGKGFSVVASEIRKLADESKKSAEKINTLVQDLQASMNSTVMVTDEGTKKTEQSINLAKELAAAFAGVTEGVNSVYLNNQQISLSSKQQSVAVQQVLSAMNAINMGAQETVSGISQVKVNTQELSNAAKQLQALV
jgi:methyl-accepting chemotaxis protein